jgi:cob(I)alamin adenosyltransferase
MALTSSPKSGGLIQVFTGNGKGKTSAALGMALRAVGGGMRVALVCFDKGGGHYSERIAIERRLKGAFDVFATGLDRMDPVTGKFRMGVTPEDANEAERGLQTVRDVFSRHEHQLVILDEINTTVSLGMLRESDVLAVLTSKPQDVEVILTGRNCPEVFKDIADLVTEMTLVKHYFYKGVAAREGLDY